MSRRIAVCALVPDVGHLTPLFVLARHLRALGKDVRAFVPDEAQHTAERFGVMFETLGKALVPNHAGLFDRAASVSRWAFQVYWWGWLVERYTVPVTAQGTRLTEGLLSRLRRYAPDILITDEHLFVPEYRWLAGQLGIPLVLNHSAGTNSREQRRKFWLDVNVERANRFGDRIRALEYAFDKRFRREKWRRLREERRQIEQSRAARATGPAPPRVERLSMGLAAIEIEELGDRISSVEGVNRFQAHTPQLVGTIEPALADWLGVAEPRSVLYVASGSIVSMPARAVRTMIREALRAGLRVLVADGSGRFSWTGDSRVLVQRWVPQTAVLAHPAIAAFVTHAGATSIQEALWNGVPVLCHPLMSDQHYNAWVAEQLGFGLCLDVSGMPRERFGLRLRRILDTPSYRETARRIGAAFRAQPGEVGACRLIDRMLEGGPSAADVARTAVE